MLLFRNFLFIIQFFYECVDVFSLISSSRYLFTPKRAGKCLKTPSPPPHHPKYSSLDHISDTAVPYELLRPPTHPDPLLQLSNIKGLIVISGSRQSGPPLPSRGKFYLYLYLPAIHRSSFCYSHQLILSSGDFLGDTLWIQFRFERI